MDERRLISWSAVELFLKCQRKYHYERVQNIERTEDSYLEVGKAYHEHLAELLGAGRPTHNSGGVDNQLVAEIEANLGRVRVEVLPHLGRTVQPVEQAFENVGLGYKGVVDAVFDSTPLVDEKGTAIGSEAGQCVIDWKVLTSDRRRSERDARCSPQLALYALATGSGRAAFVEVPRNLSKPIKVRVARYDASELCRWTLWLTDMREAILSKDGLEMKFYPRTERSNPLCSPVWCQHFVSCYPYATPTQVENKGDPNG